MVQIKHLINFLQHFQPETPVELDKNFWEDMSVDEENPQRTQFKNGLFSVRDDSKFGGSLVLIINN